MPDSHTRVTFLVSVKHTQDQDQAHQTTIVLAINDLDPSKAIHLIRTESTPQDASTATTAVWTTPTPVSLPRGTPLRYT